MLREWRGGGGLTFAAYTHGSDSMNRGMKPAVLTCALASGCVACRVVYATGEEETLELEEVIRDQQLTLL